MPTPDEYIGMGVVRVEEPLKNREYRGYNSTMDSMLPSSTPPDLLRWQKRYASEEYVFGRDPNVFLRSCAHWMAPGGRVLSVADGEGRNSVWLARNGYRVDAFDFAANAVAKARRLAVQQQVQICYGVEDIFQRTWLPAAYDGVVAIMIQFLKPAERAAVFKLFQQTLKPGGILLLTGYRPEQLALGLKQA